MVDKFTAQIDKIVENTKEKMLNVVKDSIQEVIFDAQKHVNDGGKMRVDTGFLRSSGVASLNSIPSGESKGRKRRKNEEGVLPEYMTDKKGLKGVTVEDALIKMKIGDTFYFGWTAKYAKYRETYDGFLDSALQKWKETVDHFVRKVKGQKNV